MHRSLPLLPALACAVPLAACDVPTVVTCDLAGVPTFSGFPITGCKAPFTRGFIEREDGRWWIRLANGAKVIDFWLPLDEGDGEYVIRTRADATGARDGWSHSIDNNLGGYGPFHSFEGSGTVTVGLDGDLPTRQRPGSALVELDFGSGVTLRGSDGEVTISGTALIDVVGTPASGPSTGGVCCKNLIDAMLPACDEDDETFSKGCYCASAEANLCIADSVGCVSDPETYRAEARRLNDAAKEAGMSSEDCGRGL